MGCPSAEVNLETCTKTDLKFNIKRTKIKASSPFMSLHGKQNEKKWKQ